MIKYQSKSLKNQQKTISKQKTSEVVPVTIVHFVGFFNRSIEADFGPSPKFLSIDLFGSNVADRIFCVHFHTRRIHGTDGIFTYMNGCFFWVN